MPPKLLINSGQRFGKLIILQEEDSKIWRGRPYRLFRCKCDCGREISVTLGHLSVGHTKTCGCERMKNMHLARYKHGCHPIYFIWSAMIQRCRNPNNSSYKNYGGRGITVCERWKKFENFYADMGTRPKGRSLERVKNDLGYSPENCQWATTKEQGRNTRRNRYITYKGETKCLSAWAEEFSIGVSALRQRLSTRNWPIEKAMTTPYTYIPRIRKPSIR